VYNYHVIIISRLKRLPLVKVS